ncbi:MAG: alpha/beta hydrolase [Pseudomonadota bacterium]
MGYEHLDDATINAQFMPRIAVPDHEAWLARDEKLAAEARRTRRHIADIAYGETRAQRLDVFPAENPNAPIHAYIHGGYWRALDKSGFSYIAEPLASAGATTVLVNYDLCPAVTLDEIVQQIRRALIWIYRHAGLLGGDENRIYLSGSSAGAHLVAMMLARDWSRDPVPSDFVKGAACITGIYDLDPVLRIAANEDIRLTPEMARRNSPLFMVPHIKCPIIVAVGGDEPEEWIKQSEGYVAHLKRHGVPADYLRVPATHHFSITQSLAWPDGLLLRAILAQMGLAPRHAATA